MIRILKAEQIDRNALRTPPIQEGEGIAAVVDEILCHVREAGDRALYEYAEKFDRVTLSSLVATEEEIEAAFTLCDPALIATMREAQANITAFHEKQRRTGFVITGESGVTMGQRVLPLRRVGLYVPGGTAAYPSSVLMNAVPARLAGVEEIVMTTPPAKNGSVAPQILAAARIAGVSKIVKCGGAQAVAALAYGTESVPAVDKIVGPGNAFVATAKRKVYGTVDIDMIAGPSEILIVADETAEPRCLAADLLSQAEHDRLSSAILVTASEALARATAEEIERQLPLLAREDIARASVEANGKILLARSLNEALDFANEIAPEHLELCVAAPFEYLGKVRNAGSVFLGMNTPEAVGDYWAGANHTLPTSGTARFSSPLSVDDFVKKSQFISYSREALGEARAHVERFAESEGLTAHAASVRARFEEAKV